MCEVFEDINDIMKEIEESRGSMSYLKYLSQGGRLTEMEFERVLGYQPTETDIKEIEAFFPNISLEDKILIAKIYHIISDRRICLLTDPEVYCEYLVFTNRFKSFSKARLKEEREKRKK